MEEQWQVYGVSLKSRFFLGTALYPSVSIMKEAVLASGCDVITVGLRRMVGSQTDQEVKKSTQSFFALLKSANKHLLPNTAGCKTVKEAVTLAHMARELLGTSWIKLEVIGDDYNLQPEPFMLLEATKLLIQDGFSVFPYCTDDLIVCQKLVDAGCEVVMPWASPIGTGQGILNPYALETIRSRLPKTKLIIDAGIGKPSDACKAMEMGFDGVLLNTAVAKAQDPVRMAKCFCASIEAGREAYLAGIIPKRQTARPSTPVLDTPFWHQN